MDNAPPRRKRAGLWRRRDHESWFHAGGGAKLDVAIETRDRAHAEAVLRTLAADGLERAAAGE